MLRMALRPRWIAALLLALSFAAGFVLLSQWQISRSVSQATVIERDTETTVPLTSVAEPQRGVTTEAAGQLVRVEASFVDGDFSVLGGRDHDGTAGHWLVGHAVTADGTSLAVAVGWAQTEKQALDAASNVEGGTLSGRYLATDPPADDDFEAGERSAMSVAALINEWQDQPSSVYGGYLVMSGATSSLEVIDAPPPSEEVVLNWLNIFYAVEWVVFAGFAVFLWWRFVRDAVEREEQEKAELN